MNHIMMDACNLFRCLETEQCRRCRDNLFAKHFQNNILKNIYAADMTFETEKERETSSSLTYVTESCVYVTQAAAATAHSDDR